MELLASFCPCLLKTHTVLADGVYGALTKILVTTLCCANHTSKAELKSLFKNRWHVELDLRNLKTTMGA